MAVVHTQGVCAVRNAQARRHQVGG